MREKTNISIDEIYNYKAELLVTIKKLRIKIRKVK
jgi:hypothetical protein